MKRAIPTLSLALIVAGGIIFATVAPSIPAFAATPQPSTAATSKNKDLCGATKSKWAHVQCVQFNNSAPGDEYFGRMKMSYLGIDNTYKDGAISAGDFTTDPKLISKLDFATEALHRWAQKYPNDPQLARTYFLGVQVLRKVYTQPEQQTTWEFMQILVHKYPNTYFGKQAKAIVASNGFTEHWFAVAQICPTPSPPRKPHSVVALDTPAPTPSPSPAPGQPAVDVITPPCVQPTPGPDDDTSAAPSPIPTKR